MNARNSLDYQKLSNPPLYFHQQFILVENNNLRQGLMALIDDEKKNNPSVDRTFHPYLPHENIQTLFSEALQIFPCCVYVAYLPAF
jgi:hypothetical protein